ncbi:DUF6153 family protein [Streptomyces acidiscabies]|uniref:DUF6153 family protein n=1 Tax=Streptomyces acidiscabies TaxID=42234 RepID=UPI00067E3450|nr:DUF6153 family protein [Streptomyces acidiscabies]
MTTDRRTGPRSSAVRCAWTVLVALVAALAVLVHHDTTSVAMPVHATSAMTGMDHTSGAMTSTVASGRHGTAMDDGGGACSGSAMQHCSAGDVGTVKLVPPPATAGIVRPDAFRDVSAQRDPPGTSHRAPPDLSVLSRLLL